MKEQLTINTATRTGDQQIFAFELINSPTGRKSAVNGQTSNVKCSPRGFTLVETLIAISILLIAVVGPISLIGDALHKLYFAKDEMVAINLAQEGVEVIRQKRDSDMLTTTTPDLFVSGTSYYVVDSSSATPLIPGSFAGAQQPVYLSGGFYVQGPFSMPATQFTRLVTVSDVGSSVTEKQVTSTVTWNTGNTPGIITVTEYLFKWAI